MQNRTFFLFVCLLLDLGDEKVIHFELHEGILKIIQFDEIAFLKTRKQVNLLMGLAYIGYLYKN